MVASVGTIIIDPPEGDMRLYLGSLARLRGLKLPGLPPALARRLPQGAFRFAGPVTVFAVGFGCEAVADLQPMAPPPR